MKKRKQAHFSALNSSSLVILSADVPLPLTRTQGNMKEQTMNMTKCEIPQPLSRSHFPGSCWGAGKIDALSTAFGRRVAQFLFPRQFIYIQSALVIRRLYHGSNRRKKKEEKKSSNCVVILISWMETIKSNLE